MVYVLTFFVDGGVRRNGQRGASGAAACVLKCRNGTHLVRTAGLGVMPPTNQRAELIAVFEALAWALDIYNVQLARGPRLQVIVHSDSMYAIKCITEVSP